MRIAVVGDTFPPLRTSGAVQLMDLSRELIRQGHQVTALVPDAEQTIPWVLEELEGVQVLRLRTIKFKDVNYLLRTLGETLMPHLMWRGLRSSPLHGTRWDGIVCYAPSIFHGPLVRALKVESGCRCYLIVRDVFPEWAVDLGLMRRRLPYLYFKAVAQDLYGEADCIGVQSAGNLPYFERWAKKTGRKLEVLHNWLADRGGRGSTLHIADTTLAGRKVFVYAGNMGVAQDVRIFMRVAEQLRDDQGIGFLFVGRGSDAGFMRAEAARLQLNNVAVREEIASDEVPALLAQCQVGLIALNPNHRSHNIPGKFLTYMHAGLPVLARVNPGNDLADLIRSEGVGRVVEGGDLDALVAQVRNMAQAVNSGVTVAENCRRLYKDRFSPTTAASQVLASL